MAGHVKGPGPTAEEGAEAGGRRRRKKKKKKKGRAGMCSARPRGGQRAAGLQAGSPPPLPLTTTGLRSLPRPRRLERFGVSPPLL